jgi:hypothetical protein
VDGEKSRQAQTSRPRLTSGYRLPCRQPSQFRSVHNSQTACEYPLTRVGRDVGQTLGVHRSAPAAIGIALHQPRQNDHFGKAIRWLGRKDRCWEVGPMCASDSQYWVRHRTRPFGGSRLAHLDVRGK